MTTYLATVTRDDGVWVVDIDGLPSSFFSMTEVRRFTDLDLEVRDLIAGLTEADPDSFEVDWCVMFGDVDVTKWLSEIEYAEAQVNSWETFRNDLRTEVIRAGRAAGLSQAVIGEVLRISQQRVAQLVPDSPATVGAAASHSGRGLSSLVAAPPPPGGSEDDHPDPEKQAHYTFDEYWAEHIRPRVTVMAEFANRINTTEGRLTDEDMRGAGEACTWLEHFLATTNFHGAPDLIERHIGPLRALAESMRRYLNGQDLSLRNVNVPDDLRGL